MYTEPRIFPCSTVASHSSVGFCAYIRIYSDFSFIHHNLFSKNDRLMSLVD